MEIENAFRIEDVTPTGCCFSFTAVTTDTETRIPVKLPLPGRFQIRNALTAIAAARLLAERGAPIDDSAISRGIAATSWPGRLERIAERPDIYVDERTIPPERANSQFFWTLSWLAGTSF